MLLSDDAMCVTQNSLGGGVHDSFKINPKTFLCMHMTIGYLEPFVSSDWLKRRCYNSFFKGV